MMNSNRIGFSLKPPPEFIHRIQQRPYLIQLCLSLLGSLVNPGIDRILLQ